jgi:hypothetical protein
MDAPQQAEEVGASQLTQPPPVWTQPSHMTPMAAGGATMAAAGATPAGGATPDAAGSSQAAMATPSPDQLDRTAGGQGTRPLDVRPGPHLG